MTLWIYILKTKILLQNHETAFQDLLIALLEGCHPCPLRGFCGRTESQIENSQNSLKRCNQLPKLMLTL